MDPTLSPRGGSGSRAEERLKAALHVKLADGAEAVTRDISASGIFFRSPGPFMEGDPIAFTVLLQDFAGRRKWVLECEARVLRVENAHGETGVAARILDSKLKMVD